jgi:hypothetical protein
MRNTLRSWGNALAAAARRHLRALLPPLTPKLILLALFGVLLFFCGIVWGVWLIFRYRREESQGSGA